MTAQRVVAVVVASMLALQLCIFGYMHYALERHAVFEQTDDHAAFIGANEKARGLAHPEAIVEIRSELRSEGEQREKTESLATAERLPQVARNAPVRPQQAELPPLLYKPNQLADPRPFVSPPVHLPADAAGGSHLNDRPMLVRFDNYDPEHPVHEPYGGKVALAWFLRLGWVETHSDNWDMLWCGKGQYQHLVALGKPLPSPGQVHNHCFVAGLLAGNKGSFTTNHAVMHRKFGDDYSHVPESYELPVDHAARVSRLALEPDTLWIYKPSNGARGSGIKLVWMPVQVERNIVKASVQRYIERPYLLEKRKVHLRLYVHIRELNPLRVLLFEDGLGLLASEPYSLKPQDRENVLIHLTNAAMIKGAALTPELDKAYNTGGDTERSRLAWSLRPFLEELQREHRDVAGVLSKLSDAIVKTILSGQAQEPFANRRPGSCFDIFGIDVMFDHELKPFVLELNLAPQLGGSASDSVNHRVHERLLHGLLELSGPTSTNATLAASLRLRVMRLAEDLGIPPCSSETEEPWPSPRPGARCVGDREVAMIARLEDESVRAVEAHFVRIYPAAGTAAEYDKYWMNGEMTVAQQMANAWVELRALDGAPGFPSHRDWKPVADRWLANLQAGPGAEFDQLSQIPLPTPILLPEWMNPSEDGQTKQSPYRLHDGLIPTPAPLHKGRIDPVAEDEAALPAFISAPADGGPPQHMTMQEQLRAAVRAKRGKLR